MGQRWKHGDMLPQMNGSGMVRNLRAAMSLAGAQADVLEAAAFADSSNQLFFNQVLGA